MTRLKKICWKTAKKQFSQPLSWKKALLKSGYETVSDPEEAALYIFDWKTLIKTPTHHKPYRGTPLFLIEESCPEHIRAIPDSVDDLVTLDQKVKHFIARLDFKIRQAHDRKELQDSNEQKNNQLATSEIQLKQREEFLGVCAHDLRSPLGIIDTSLGMILNAVKQGGPVQKFEVELLERSKRQAQHGISLVHDLLDLTSLDQGLKPQYEVLHLDIFLNEFSENATIQCAQKGIHFNYQNIMPHWRVLADSHRVEQLLQNLLTNAIKFTEPGKNIFLRVEPFIGRRKTDPPYPMMVMSLRDEGKGIPESETQKIFDRFAQVKRQKVAGHGLGLTVAKQISNLHDGNIWVRSKEGEGSTFNVLLPHVISRPSHHHDEKKRVLIAEPSSSKREAYYSGLSDLGYEVVYVKDGVEAITYLFHYLPEVLILTADLKKIDEVEVSKIAKADSVTAGIPILFTTDPAHPFTPKHEEMAWDAVEKLPLTADRLREILNDTLKKKAA